MEYLVLRRFWSYGKLLEKGTVVDESEIRSPGLRRSEGKITPAVSSPKIPAEFDAEDIDSQVSLTEVGILVEPVPDVIEEPQKQLFKLFGKKD